MKEQTTTEKLFHKYNYLAKVYANKVFDLHKIALEKKDVEQELSIKIFTSIEAYGKRYSEYLETGNNKPVPLKYYIKLSLINKVRDYIKVINYEINKGSTSLDEIGFDQGIDNNTYIDPSKNKFIVNDIDLLSGLKKDEAAVFSMFLKGFNANKISKIHRNDEWVDAVINMQINKLQGVKKQLMEGNENYQSFNYEE